MKQFNVGDYILINKYAGVFTVGNYSSDDPGFYRIIADNCTGRINSISGDIAYVLWDSDQFFTLDNVKNNVLLETIKFDNTFVAAVNFDYIILDKKRTREYKLNKLGI